MHNSIFIDQSSPLSPSSLSLGLPAAARRGDAQAAAAGGEQRAAALGATAGRRAPGARGAPAVCAGAGGAGAGLQAPIGSVMRSLYILVWRR